MKNFLRSVAVVLIAAGMIHAGSTTARLGLYNLDAGEVNWKDEWDSNFSILDKALQWDQVSGNCTSTTAGVFTCAAAAASEPYLFWTANQAFLPASSFAQHDTRNAHPVLDYDAAADECAYFGGVLPEGYNSGGLNVTIAWMATNATSGAPGWLTAFERHQDDAFDLDADGFGTEKSTSATTASASGEVQYTTIAHTNGAEIDSVAAGESFRLRICRDGDGSTVTDDMTGDAELYKIVVEEP